MKPYLTLGTVDIYLCHIDNGAAQRRVREQAAISAMIERIFGTGIRIEHNETGAPYLPGRPESISVSHSRHTAALAVDRAGAHIGIDIEEARPQLEKVASRVLSDRETALYGPSAHTLVAAWTLKEAAYKCAGTPGLDFRNDIALPDEPTAGNTVTAAGKKLEILVCRAAGSEWLSAVYLK